MGKFFRRCSENKFWGEINWNSSNKLQNSLWWSHLLVQSCVWWRSVRETDRQTRRERHLKAALLTLVHMAAFCCLIHSASASLNFKRLFGILLCGILISIASVLWPTEDYCVPSAWLAVSFPHTGLWKITSVSSITAAIKSAVHLRACERVTKTHPMQKTCCRSLSLQGEPERADASLSFDSPLGLSDCLYSERLSAVSGCVSLRSPQSSRWRFWSGDTASALITVWN